MKDKTRIIVTIRKGNVIGIYSNVNGEKMKCSVLDMEHLENGTGTPEEIRMAGELLNEKKQLTKVF